VDDSNKPSINRLITAGLAISDQSASEADELGFMARAFLQATLPHRKAEGTYFQRVNGNFTLTLMAPPDYGLPYGPIPRLLLAFVTSEAVRNRSRDIELGDSMTSFMKELGMTATGGRWGSITRLKDQTNRLFRCSVNASYSDKQKDVFSGFTIADSAVLWWDPKQPDQGSLWKSTVRLSERFYEEVVNRPVPVDMRALKALKGSPLALDIYCWLTYRLSYLTKPTVIPWDGLALQFGSNYADIRNFKTNFVKELRKVVQIYAEADVQPKATGLAIRPSRTHIK